MVHLTKDMVSDSNGVMMYKRRKIREQTSRAKLRIHPALREKLLNANESDYILWNGKDGRDERRHHLDYAVPRVVRVAGAIQKGAKEHMGYATRLRNSGSTPG